MRKKIYLFIGLVTGACWLLPAQKNSLPQNIQQGTIQQDTLQQSIKRGEQVYATNCASCHQLTGLGLEAVYPAVANTSYLKDQQKIIGVVLYGQEGEISVEGKQYNTPMPPLPQLSDKEVADVLNYVSYSWGNKNAMITPAQVKAARK